jgi:uncharacterized protein YwgA
MASQLSRFGTIMTLVELLRHTGKIRLQKLLYFLQEGWGVQLGYDFVMYHYGPYCAQVDADLSVLVAAGVVKISVDLGGYGYHVVPGELRPASLVEAAQGLEEIRSVLEAFPQSDAASLELAATVHFVHSLMPGAQRHSVVEQVRALKPKFSVAAVEAQYDRLASLRLIK